jgi:hypothetical protein
VVRLATKREWLVERDLAKVGRGKFSKDAHAALDTARAEGVVFDDDAAVSPAPEATEEV